MRDGLRGSGDGHSELRRVRQGLQSRPGLRGWRVRLRALHDEVRQQVRHSRHRPAELRRLRQRLHAAGLVLQRHVWLSPRRHQVRRRVHHGAVGPEELRGLRHRLSERPTMLRGNNTDAEPWVRCSYPGRRDSATGRPRKPDFSSIGFHVDDQRAEGGQYGSAQSYEVNSARWPAHSSSRRRSPRWRHPG